MLVEAFLESGIDARLVDDLATERWRKLVWNILFNGLAVAEGGVTVDKILGDPELKARCRALMDETITAAPLVIISRNNMPICKLSGPTPWARINPRRWSIGLPEGNWRLRRCGRTLRRARKIELSLPHLQVLYEHLKQLQSPTSQALRGASSRKAQTPLPSREDRPT